MAARAASPPRGPASPPSPRRGGPRSAPAAQTTAVPPRPRAAPPAQTTACPLVSLGLLADVQYADIDDGFSFHGTPRYYRAALEGARRSSEALRESRVDALLHLGDILDAQAAPEGVKALSRVVDALNRAGCRQFHTVGNHCLAAVGRPALNAHLELGPVDGVSYYSAALAPGVRLIALDGFDISLLGWPEGHPKRVQAEHLLATHNPNANKLSADGLHGAARRFVAFGGGVGEAQLAWLEATLGEARRTGERAIIACHLPIHPATAPGVCLLYNYEAVLEVLAAAGRGVVAATLAGHSHADAHVTCEATGVHHRVLKAVLETPPGDACHAVLELWADRVVVRGTGVACSGAELVPLPGPGVAV